MTLITRGCLRAIRTGEERLTAPLLDGVRIDEASEQARAQLAAAFAAGRLTAAPASRKPARSGAS
jgi:ribosomal protein L12E/L44/L45/RPP1/RPP2